MSRNKQRSFLLLQAAEIIESQESLESGSGPRGLKVEITSERQLKCQIAQ